MLRDEIAKYTELSGNDGEHTPIGIIGAYLDGYDKGLELSVSENPNKWIPVSERLPENSDYVLVTDGLDMFVAWHNPEKERFKGWHSFDELFDLQTPILAWQPLPEPYKADREVSE